MLTVFRSSRWSTQTLGPLSLKSSASPPPPPTTNPTTKAKIDTENQEWNIFQRLFAVSKPGCILSALNLGNSFWHSRLSFLILFWYQFNTPSTTEKIYRRFLITSLPLFFLRFFFHFWHSLFLKERTGFVCLHSSGQHGTHSSATSQLAWVLWWRPACQLKERVFPASAPSTSECVIRACLVFFFLRERESASRRSFFFLPNESILCRTLADC